MDPDPSSTKYPDLLKSEFGSGSRSLVFTYNKLMKKDFYCIVYWRDTIFGLSTSTVRGVAIVMILRQPGVKLPNFYKVKL